MAYYVSDMQFSDKQFDQFLDANVAAAVCSPSEPVKARIGVPAQRIKAMGLLRKSGGYARYAQNVFGISSAQLRLLSENSISMEVIRPAVTHQAA